MAVIKLCGVRLPEAGSNGERNCKGGDGGCGRGGKGDAATTTGSEMSRPEALTMQLLENASGRDLLPFPPLDQGQPNSTSGPMKPAAVCSGVDTRIFEGLATPM